MSKESEAALEICLTYKNPAIQKAFGSLGAYADHCAHESESALKVIKEPNGEIRVIKNNDRKLSGQTAVEILKAWQDPAVKAEFQNSFGAYKCFIEATRTGKAKIIGRHAVV